MPVDERALIKRVNRIIGKDGRKLMKNHPARSRKGKRRLLTKREHEFGTYFVVRARGDDAKDETRVLDRVVDHHVDLEELARKCGALEAFEFLDIEETYGRR